MKKILVFSLILSMVLCCCACNEEKPTKKPNNKVESGTQEPTTSDTTESDVNSDVNSDTSNDNFNTGVNNNSNSQDNSTSVKPTVVKDRIPYGTIQFDGNYDKYYIVEPRDEHPGVVNYDATYEMLIYDYAGKRVTNDEITIKVNNPKVTIIGTTVIVPFEVRKGYERVEVTVENKKDPKKKGTYRFEFLQFTDEPTFEDDFSEDRGIWVEDAEGGQFGLKLPLIRDGKMEMIVTGRNMEDGVRSCVNYKQAYGSFSASMKMPMESNAIGSFWLFTSANYIPNPEAPGSTVGEIDIVEFLTASRIAMMTVHWFDYGEHHKQSNLSPVVTYDPGQFATYSVVWAPGKIWWYIDGKLYKTSTGAEEGAGNGRGGMYPILQAGYFTDDRGFNPLDKIPATVYVDYVEIYGLILD